MFALYEVLCPTQFYGLSFKLLPAVTAFARTSEYDWRGLVLEHLLFYLMRFEKTFETHGFTSGYAGCTIFLGVFYLDRLKRKPICWGLRPRIKYWNTQSINVAKEEDKLDTGDYGKLRVHSSNTLVLCGGRKDISFCWVASSSSMVDKQYVDVASRLYTKVWADKWIGRAKQLMLTPKFSKEVLSSKITQKEILKTHNFQLNPCNADELNSVFVPVSSFGKWWAICFSFNRKEIQLIDPTATLVKSQRQASMKMAKIIGKLVVGLPKDEMISSWPCIEVQFSNPCDKSLNACCH